MENVHIAILEVRLMSFVMWQLVALFPKSQSYNCGNLEDEIDKILYKRLHQEVCSKCIKDGLAIEESMVANPIWYYKMKTEYIKSTCKINLHSAFIS